jgi:hypothetical protein
MILLRILIAFAAVLIFLEIMINRQHQNKRLNIAFMVLFFAFIYAMAWQGGRLDLTY